MRIETVATVKEIVPKQVIGRTVIVIDVLRASSTIITAFEAGFLSVIPAETPENAWALQTENTKIAGEVFGKKVEGFDYQNSPTELLREKQAGKHLILSTTNGTRAIFKAQKAKQVFIGCFLNAASCIERALFMKDDITLYCAGTRNEFALEDGLAAGLMIHLAKKTDPSVEVCDLSKALEASYQQLEHLFPNLFLSTTTGKRLVENQYRKDIFYCCRINISQIVPIVCKNRIFPFSSS